MGCAKSKEAQSQKGKRPFSFRSFHRRSHHRGNNGNETTQAHSHSHNGNDTTQAHSHSHRLSNGQNVVSNQSVKKNDNKSADRGDRISKEYNQRNTYSDESGKTYSDETGHKVARQDPRIPTTTSSDEAEAKSNNTGDQVKDSRKPTTTSLGETEAKAEVEAVAVAANAREPVKYTKDYTPTSWPNFTDNNNEFSFQVVTDASPTNDPIVMGNDMEPKPMWLQMAANDAVPSTRTIISDFDPEIISTFRKALEELSPNCAAILRSPESEAFPSPGHHRLISGDSKDGTPSPGHSRLPSKDGKNDTVTSRGHNKVVLYFTSLRGIKKTYEDCCKVSVVLKGMGVKVDERDVSMHYGFRDELRQLLGTEGLLGNLPRVFVKGKYIGGAEDIERMHDSGELEKILKGCEMVNESDGSLCKMCGDVKFVPCEMCSGSCKIYVEGDGHGGEDEGDGDGGFRRCPYCNENGIARCPGCCSE